MLLSAIRHALSVVVNPAALQAQRFTELPCFAIIKFCTQAVMQTVSGFLRLLICFYLNSRDVILLICWGVVQDEIQRLGPSVEALSKDGVMDTILTKVIIPPFFLACLHSFFRA